jgi:hypothetical protein
MKVYEKSYAIEKLRVRDMFVKDERKRPLGRF